MAFSLSFGQTTKSRNSTLVPSVGNTTQVLLKDNTSVVKPVFTIHLGKGGAPANLSALSQMNYCYCPEFKRYYYIVDMQSETAVIVNIYCEVDVLATFKEDILKTPAFVYYSQSRYNSLVPDNRLHILGTSSQFAMTTALPSFNSEGSFALTAVSPNSTGETGTATTIVCAPENLAQIAAKLYAEDFWESIKTDFYHPEEAILGCMWTPIDFSQAEGGGASTIQIGKYNLYTGFVAKRNVSFTIMASFHIPYSNPEGEGSLGDFRNFDPYTKYFMTLPGVGKIEIPMRLVSGRSITNQNVLSIPVNVSCSPVTGDVTYMIKLMNASGGISGNGDGLFVKGNFGVEVPVSRAVGRYGSLLQTGLSSGVSTLGLLAVPGAGVGLGLASLASGMVPAAINAMNVNTNIVGGLGGWAVLPPYLDKLETTTVAWDLSDAPSGVAKTIGRPYFHHVNALSECSGVTQCTGAHVKTWATEQEHGMINALVNTNINQYGGIIIE